MRVPRVPRNRIVAKTGGETTVLHSRFAAETIATGVGAQTYGSWYATPTNSKDPASGIAANYMEYRIDSVKLIYTPSCGTTTAGNIWFCFFDNAEMIDKVRSNYYGTSTAVLVAQTTAVQKGTQVWEQMEMNIPLTPRYKWFQINLENPTGIEEINRTIQGCCLWGTAGAPSSTTLGTVSLEYRVTFKGLQNNLYSDI
nr:structural protein [Tolivirales sp.]